MSDSIKPTPGPWHVANGVQIRGEREQIAKVWMMRGGEGKANASLIAEAGTVRGETGLTPRQLVERVKELEGALRKYEDVREDMFSFFLSNGIFNQCGKRYDCSALNNAHLQARAALAKCQGEKE